ncbi:hypothetical protein ACQ4PT_069738 [Festuca glaucescens]
MLSSSASRRDAAATASAAAAAAAASSTTSSTTAKTADQPLPTKTFAQRAGDALAAAASRSGELTKNATMAVSRSGELTKNATMAAVREAAAASTTKADALAAVREAAANAVQHEGWMVRYGRRKIGRSFFHTRYFVLESKLLAYYKKKPKDSVVPLKSLLIDGNCRVEDRGLKTHHGQMIYVLCVYNKKEKEHQITMGAYDIEDALAWKKKIEQIIDQDFASSKNFWKLITLFVWPRDLCYVRYWRRNDDGSYGKFLNYVPVLPPLLLVASSDRQWLREYFSQTDECHITPRIPVMENMVDPSMPKDQKRQEIESKIKAAHGGQKDNKSMSIIDEESDEDEDYQVPEANIEEDSKKSDNDAKHTEEPPEKIDLSCFSGILNRDTDEKSRNCWTVPDSTLFKVRSKNFPTDKSKIPAPSYLMELAAIDWFKDTKRMDNVGRQKGCVAQVAAEKGMHTFVANIQIPGSTHYSIVMYFVTSTLKKGSLLQRFFDGDDEFRNSRLKLIPAVPKVDVDIGSSAVANGVLGLVFGVVTTLVVDMAFLIQANTYDELPEQVIGAARLAHVEPAAAIVPDLDNNSDSKDSSNDDNNNNTSSEDDSSKKTN